MAIATSMRISLNAIASNYWRVEDWTHKIKHEVMKNCPYGLIEGFKVSIPPPVYSSFCQYFSLFRFLLRLNWLPINALLACKRCPLSPLLTPFWSPIRYLLEDTPATNWLQKTYKGGNFSCFQFSPQPFSYLFCKHISNREHLCLLIECALFKSHTPPRSVKYFELFIL